MLEMSTDFLSRLGDPRATLMIALVLALAAAITYSVQALGMPRCHRPPVTKGQLHLFDDDGEGHFLSAKMSTAGLEQLLKDLNRRRFG